MNESSEFKSNATDPPAPSKSEQSADFPAGVTADFSGTVDHVPDTGEGGTGSSLATPEFSVDPTPAPDAVTAAPPKRRRERPTVPGYEILGELGRGGMGVVYEARQTRLNRTVALKMVLAGAHASPQQLARFDQEARAVARLQHPNIVQIYEIGEHDGLPFFSLEFVDGGTLDKLIGRKPQPPHAAAELVQTLARAMSFAHEQNIIHRDLKPANILLTATKAHGSAGSVSLEPGGRSHHSWLGKALSSAHPVGAAMPTPKITDFGLAKAVEEDAAGQTASGTVLGTPSYMAPEQARGAVAEIGPSSDLYALGVILYEMLTGRPPFQGATILDTLDQVRHREPVHPTQLQPKVPIDLETICLKCLQKEAAKRYAGCAELADDLHRFLAGEPILARPVSGAERLWRWCKRNPWVAGLTAAIALLLALTTAGSLWTAWTLSQKNEAIEREKGSALESAERARKSAIDAEAARKVAEAARKVADAESRVATDQAGVALTTLQTLVDKVQTRLDETPGTQELKKELLNTALDGAQQVSKRAEVSTSIEATRAAAHMRLGQLFKQLGQSEKAMAEFRKVYEITKARVPLKQGSDASRRNLAAALLMLGDMDKELRRDMKSALANYKESLLLWEAIDRSPKADDKGEGLAPKPVVTAGVAELNTVVGATYLRLGSPAVAAPYFRKALAARRQMLQAAPSSIPNRLDVARSLLALGDVSFRMNDPATAAASFTECLAVVEGVFRERPKVLAVKQELGRACALSGDFYLRSGDLAKARPLFERSLTLGQELTNADPKQVLYQWDLGHAHYRLGLLALRSNDAAGARGHFEGCRAVREKLAGQDRANDRRQMEFMLALAHCSEHARAAAIATKLLGGTPDGELLIDVARCYAWCAVSVAGDAGLRTRYTNEATQAVEKAVKLGYRDEVYLTTEVDLDPLRSHKAFARVLEALRRGQR